MKTNKFFNFSRFCNLLSYDLRINGVRYLSFLVGGMIIFYLAMLIIMSNTQSNFTHHYYIHLFLSSLIGLGLFIGSAFPELNNKIKTGNYLLLPASTLEKTISQFLVYFVFGSIFLLLIFWMDTYLAKWTALQMESVQRRGIMIEDFQYVEISQGLPGNPLYKLIIVISVVSAGLFLFTARLFFKRFAFIKSVILLAIVTLLFVCGMVLFSHIFYPEQTKGFSIALPRYNLASGLDNMIDRKSVV